MRAHAQKQQQNSFRMSSTLFSHTHTQTHYFRRRTGLLGCFAAGAATAAAAACSATAKGQVRARARLPSALLPPSMRYRGRRFMRSVPVTASNAVALGTTTITFSARRLHHHRKTSLGYRHAQFFKQTKLPWPVGEWA